MGNLFQSFSAKSCQPADAGPNSTVEQTPTADGYLWGTKQQRAGREPNVAQSYKPLRRHPELFDADKGWKVDWFDPPFLEAVRADTREAWSKVLTPHIPGQVFSLKVFTHRFCQMLIEEVDNFQKSGLPARRPNSMNNYGIILNEIGWRPMVDSLQDNALSKMFKWWWPHITGFDAHHTFIVRYKETEDLHLDMHTDDSDVTFNLCLGKEFSGAPLIFCGVMGTPEHRRHSHTFNHTTGTAIFHLGKLRHGAGDIKTGERLNLIIWSHSSSHRASPEYTRPGYSKEDGAPDNVCLSYTHDRDYGVFAEYDAKNARFQGGGWCPRRGYEYDGFKAEDKSEEGGGARG